MVSVDLSTRVLQKPREIAVIGKLTASGKIVRCSGKQKTLSVSLLDDCVPLVLGLTTEDGKKYKPLYHYPEALLGTGTPPAGSAKRLWEQSKEPIGDDSND